MIGFKIDELMTGSHHFNDKNDPNIDKPMNFNLTWGNKNIINFLNPFSNEFLFGEARGIITVNGLVEKAKCEGSIKLLYFTERKIRYELIFKDDNGKSYKYIGEKRNLWPWNLYKTHVTCYGSLIDSESGDNISESITYFPYRKLIPFLLSFRLRLNSVFKY